MSLGRAVRSVPPLCAWPADWVACAALEVVAPVVGCAGLVVAAGAEGVEGLVAAAAAGGGGGVVAAGDWGAGVQAASRPSPPANRTRSAERRDRARLFTGCSKECRLQGRWCGGHPNVRRMSADDLGPRG